MAQHLADWEGLLDNGGFHLYGQVSSPSPRFVAYRYRFSLPRILPLRAELGGLPGRGGAPPGQLGGPRRRRGAPQGGICGAVRDPDQVGREGPRALSLKRCAQLRPAGVSRKASPKSLAAPGVADAARAGSPDLAMERARELMAGYKKETEGLRGAALGMPAEWPEEEEWVEQWRNQVRAGKGQTAGQCPYGQDRERR